MFLDLKNVLHIYCPNIFETIIIVVFLSDSGKYTTNKQGNCLRLFSLQAVSADAMRKVFDNPDDFEEKKTRLKQYCKSNLTNPRNNELLSRKVVFCGFYTFA